MSYNVIISIGHNKRKKIIDIKANSERIAKAGTLKGNNETINLGERELKM